MRITSIKQQVKRQDRYSIFVDGKYSFSLSESALLSEGLASGQELDTERLKGLIEASGADKAYGNALRYVAIRPRSIWEIRTYLGRKDVEEPVAENILQRLQALGMASDLEFARSWVASRRLLKNVSKRKLRVELLQKHVPDSVIEQVMTEDEGDERDELRQLVAKRSSRYPDETKLIQYLARQGFNYDDIKEVLSERSDF